MIPRINQTKVNVKMVCCSCYSIQNEPEGDTDNEKVCEVINMCNMKVCKIAKMCKT